jgi:hypothetical protein
LEKYKSLRNEKIWKLEGNERGKQFRTSGSSEE